MNPDLDPATSGTTEDWVWSERLDAWLPIIRGGAEGDPPPEGDGTSTENDDATSGDNDDEGSDDKDKFVPQDKVNEIVARETAKAKRGLLSPKELGFESAKEMKDFIDAQKAKNESEKSEEDKAREKEISDAKAEAEAGVLSTANQRLVRAQFMLEAAKHDVEHEPDAFALAQTLELWEGVEVDDKGEVIGFDKSFFEALKEAKPFLFKTDDGAQSSGGSAGAGAAGDGKGGKATRTEALTKLYPALRDTQAWAEHSANAK